MRFRPSVTTLSLSLILLLTCPQTTFAGLAEELYLNFLPPNEAAMAVTPPSILFAETPIVIRFTLMGAIAIYDPQAACQPKALSFFGTRDPIKPSFCEVDNLAILQSYATHRALNREFPREMKVYENFLRKKGLNPISNSRDRNNINGYANFLGDRVADFFAKDGWNSLGDASSDFVTGQFQDFTNYVPVNPPELSPLRLYRPLRWQPFTSPAANFNGRYFSQVHVVPHIGITGRHLVLSGDEAKKRAVTGPFQTPDRVRYISFSDRRKVRSLLKEVTDISARLTTEQRFLARWWDNKLLSTAAISAYYERAARLSRFQIAQQFLGEMVSQHDALLIAWREKRRFDQARPRTVLRFLLKNQSFRAFLGDGRGFGTVTAQEWEPLVKEQPHSEFPSGSAALCAAALEHLQTYVSAKLGTKRIPDIKIRYPKGSLPFFMSQDRTVAYDDPAEAARGCGMSRLWAGVHFRPAIDAGFQIGKGIGNAAFEHLKLLGDGIVPKNCARCVKARATILKPDPTPITLGADPSPTPVGPVTSSGTRPSGDDEDSDDEDEDAESDSESD